jgi:hypothetical protein
MRANIFTRDSEDDSTVSKGVGWGGVTVVESAGVSKGAGTSEGRQDVGEALVSPSLSMSLSAPEYHRAICESKKCHQVDYTLRSVPMYQ